MIDAHCHIDLYPDPSQVAREALAAKVGTIIVTNLPSAFRRAFPFVGQTKGLKLALGLHPLMAREHTNELLQFRQLVDQTFYIGEVGLDFSPEGIGTKDLQLQSFRFVLDVLGKKPKFISLHSRRAEAVMLELLQQDKRGPVAFHWYSGSLTVLRDAVAQGHFFSVNPAMVESPNGRRIIETIPPEQMLTESDGPFVKIGQRSALPTDVVLVEEYLSGIWQMPRIEVTKQIKSNFVSLLANLKGQSADQ